MAHRLTLSRKLANWVYPTTLEALPEDVVRATKLRLLDVTGLALLGAGSEIGRSVRKAALAMSGSGPCHILGTGNVTGVAAAAFANAVFANAMEFDDFHIESLVHMSSPAVAAGLALSETVPVSGSTLIAAIAIGNEISCRIGSAAGSELLRRGFHPTALCAPFGAAYLSAKLLGLGIDEIMNAAGICGSRAAGMLDGGTDSAHSKPLQCGWAAQGGIAAAFLAWAGNRGPANVFEGGFGSPAYHVQDTAAQLDLHRIDAGLGSQWESRNALFKPYPAADVIQPYIRALLRLRARGIVPEEVERIECPVPPFIMPMVCEPLKEKCAPASDAAARVSLQYSVAEALYRNSLGRDAYSADSLRNPNILDLARKVACYADAALVSPGSLKGSVRIVLKDGRAVEEKEELGRASQQNLMTEGELLAKFHDNAAVLPEAARQQLAEQILNLERQPDAGALVPLAVAFERRFDVM